jgi:cardiolipin synthase A/B
MAAPLTVGHQLELLEQGAAFFPALVHAIDASRVEVRLETYTFHFDTSGELVAHALVRAAQRGVPVCVVMDGIGTPEIPAQWVQRFIAAGVKWYVFSPLGTLGMLIPVRWRRLHRKLCVVDGQVAFCGGINIQDDLVDLNHGEQESPRFDFAIQVTGPLVADMHLAMTQLWARLQAKHQLKRLRLQAAREVLLDSLKVAAQPKVAAQAVDFSHKYGALAALVLRDNVHNRTRIERTYRKAIADARQEVFIANAYFLPGHKLRRALILAARRGVRVRLLLQGRYEYFMQYHASRPVYGSLLAAGVEIYEYGHGFLHAKVAVIDGVWATVGSSNLEPLSLLLAREANVVVHDAVFAQGLRARLEVAIASHGVLLDRKAYASRPLHQRFWDWVAFGLMRLSLFLLGRRY